MGDYEVAIGTDAVAITVTLPLAFLDFKGWQKWPRRNKKQNELNSEADMGTKKAWTPERRARQAEIIRQTKPWARATGPRTPEGKAVSSQNARITGAVIEARESREAIMQAVLEIFGRERRPRPRRPRK